MTTKEQVIFKLNALCRFDEEVKAFVGYIPRLGVYTQSRTKDDLPKALHSTALNYILACANKSILSSILRDSGARMKSVTLDELHEQAAHGTTEFVCVLGYEECTELVEVSVPLSLIAAQKNMEAYA